MIRNLQLLRAIAACTVFVYHFLAHYFVHLNPDAKYLTFGAVGVDVFFVISGFIMVVTTSDGKSGPSDFLAKRVARIVPIYWIVTLLLFAIALAGLRPVGIMRVEPNWLIKSLLFIPFDRDGRIEPLNAVGWTLNYEMYFYAFFAAFLILRQTLVRVSLLCMTMSTLTLFSLRSDLGLYAKFYTNPIIMEFVLGCALGYVFHRTQSIKFSNQAFSIGLIISGIAIITIAQAITISLGITSELNGFMRPLIWGMAGLLIVAGTVLLERSGHVVHADWLVALGNASYSIYLIHELILHATSKVAGALLPLGFLYLLVTFLVGIAASAGLGLLLYHWVERPANRWVRSGLETIFFTDPQRTPIA
jgi:exopolysaccharide production protein ExoZ